jgi:glucokinase
VLAVDHVEDSATQVPMISRILQLLVIDILTVGVAMRRPGQAPGLAAGDSLEAVPRLRSNAEAATDLPTPTPGVSTASPLARMTLHSR